MKKLLVMVFSLTLFAVMVVPAIAAPAHQSAAAELKGEVAELMPEHVVGEQPGQAHQSAAADLKGDVANLVPDHVRP